MLINVRVWKQNKFIFQYFSVYEQFKFHAPLSWAWKMLCNLKAWSEYKLFVKDDHQHVSKDVNASKGV